MKFLNCILVLSVTSLLLTSCSKKDGVLDDGTPEPGSTKVVVVDLIYHSSLITGSTSYATWPTFKFAADDNAKSYKVRLYDFAGTWTHQPNDDIYEWEKGELPPTEYNIFPETLGIKDGMYWMAIGRTWCSGCSAPNPVWIDNYTKGWGANGKAEVTYQY